MLPDEMAVEDFSLEQDVSRPNKLVSCVFGSRRMYFEGQHLRGQDGIGAAAAWEFHARAYLSLIASRGRNEPDDRIWTIEVLLDTAVDLKGNLIAIIVPHTIWSDESHAPWLEELEGEGVAIAPYSFVPGRHPEYYHALLEAEVRLLYQSRGHL